MIAVVPTPIRLIPQSAVVRLLDLDQLLAALETAFKALSAGTTSVPPRIAARVPDGLLAAMPGYVPGLGLVTKLVSVFPHNHDRGLPSHQALIALFDESDGRALAIMDGTEITAVRTGASAAVAVRALAPEEVRVLAILGAGVQGGTHLRAVTRVRAFTEVRVASRDPEHAQRLAAQHPGATVAATFEAAVRGADVVCCCTDASAPVLEPGWLAPGVTVTSVGAGGPELPPEVVAMGLLCVESRMAFQPYPAGAHELQGLDPQTAVELGEVLAGTRPGRTSREQVAVYKSMGHAVEDAAAARLVYDRAEAEGAGQVVTL
jgi:ornithine cyclodeaminase/alanine dehydrogenase-like protein (mu-crystallin family)